MLDIARAELGEDTVLELDQELVLSLECHICRTTTEVLRPISQVTLEEGHCPGCGELREVRMTHAITGHEPFLERTLLSVGVPPLHIIRARNSVEYRFFELTGDLESTLHFNHFVDPPAGRRARTGTDGASRIKLGPLVPAETLKVRPRPRLEVKLERPTSDTHEEASLEASLSDAGGDEPDAS
jgi:hypothetical protein